MNVLITGNMRLKRMTAVYIFALLTLAVFTGAFAFPGSSCAGQITFNDLPTDAQVYPYVNYLVEKGIFKGFPDGTFRAGEGVTRAQTARVVTLVRGLAPVIGGTPTFSDVPATHWAYGDIEAASKAGYFKGYPDGTFNPEGVITRAEAITLLLNLSGGKLSGKAANVADVPAGHWAYQQVATALEAGILELDKDNLFQPDQAFRRGDLARGLSVMFTLGPDLRPAELTGKLVAKKGKVTVTGRDGVSREVTMETTVGRGDKIKTGENSQAEIIFDDGSGLMIEAGAELEIVKTMGFNYMRRNGSPGVAVDKLEIKLNKGRIFGALASRYETTAAAATANRKSLLADGVLLASKSMPPGVAGMLLAENETETAWWEEPYSERERVVVDMPWGVAAIRGTFWTNLVDALRQSTALITGQATVTANGQTVSLNGLQSTVLTSPGAVPTPPAGLSEADSQAWAAVADWVNERALAIQNNLPPPPAPAIIPFEVVEQILQLEQIEGVDVPSVVTQALYQAISGVSTPAQNTTNNNSGNGGSNSSGGDQTPPTVLSTDPANNADEVPVNQVIIINFSEGVHAGSSYDSITVRDAADNPVSVEKSISGQTLTLNPAGGLVTGAPVSGTMRILFDIPVVDDDNVEILLTDGVNTITINGSISNNELSVPYGTLYYGTTYTVTIPAGSVRSSDYDTYNDEISWDFTTRNN